MITIDGKEYIFTNDILESGYIIHNDNQVSIEVNGMIKLIEVENYNEFVKQHFE